VGFGGRFMTTSFASLMDAKNLMFRKSSRGRDEKKQKELTFLCFLFYLQFGLEIFGD
jgi:hypothetical protein